MTIQAVGTQDAAALSQTSATQPSAPHHHHHHHGPPPATDATATTATPGTDASDPSQSLDSLASALGTSSDDLLGQLSSGTDLSSLFGPSGAATWNQQSAAGSGLGVDLYA